MAEHGVDVVTGIGAAAPEALVTAWLEGRLVRGDNACDGSGEDGHHHHHDQPHHGGDCHCAH